MGGDRNTVHLLTRHGETIDVDSWPVMSKEEVATALIAKVGKKVAEKVS
jgi:phosphopantothenoylcysteine decarboxylase/phosphopantothenate--cysteine ligase